MGSSGFPERSSGESLHDPAVFHLWHVAASLRAVRYRPLNAEISEEFPYPRAIFVPIDLPAAYESAVKSAAPRALGPIGDVLERSGVGFTMRSIGARKARASSASAAAAEEEEDDDSVQSVQSDGGGDQADADQEPDLAAMPLDTMSQA